jgi:RHS repeat-associated protein
MRMLCAAESGPLAPPQPWRSAAPHSAPSLPAAHFSTELFSLAARARTSAEPVSPEKPHQGVASKKAAPHQAEIARNSTTALGLSWHWQSGTAPGARVTYDYDAYGNTVNTTGSTPNVYLYRGEQYDSDLGLYYLRARYFNPTAGRFLTRDQANGVPERPDTLHKYLYAAADPIDNIDPSGRNALPITPWPTPGPQPVPNPQPQPRSGQGSGATSEYMMLVAFISMPVAAAVLPGVRKEIQCAWAAVEGCLEAAADTALGLDSETPVPQEASANKCITKCVCKLRGVDKSITADIYRDCPPRVWGIGAGRCQCHKNAKATAPAKCRRYYAHCQDIY